MIDAPGIHDLPVSYYHADPVCEPSLSSSIARLLVHRSPLHAWYAHPKLNPAQEPNYPSDEMEWGTIVHRLLLGAGPEFVEIDADNWKKKHDQEARDAARKALKVPVLSRKLAELKRCAAAAGEQIRSYPEIVRALEAGKPEQTLVWRDGEAWCRALVDWLPDDPRAPLIDLKTTGLSAEPSSWERRLISEYAMQAAFYTRGAAAVRDVKPGGMRLVVIELRPPYALSVIAPAPSLEEMAHADIEEAIERWTACLAANEWPGYPTETAWVEAPPWAQMRQQERGLRNQFMRDRRRLDADANHYAEINRRHMIAIGEAPPS